MITDYKPFLRVAEDGRIWWVLRDALRLGAGYLPVRDDHQTLETELRALNDRALLNERTLIGAFQDERLALERPLTFEHDGFRYVDAEGFLAWLSQYITRTQATEIAFPNELASEVRRAKAKAAASQLPAASQEFDSLSLALGDWFDRNLDDLPLELRQRTEREFCPIPWDQLSAGQRRYYALQQDYLHDPATEQDRQFWWNFSERLHELQAQMKKWKSTATPTASEILLKDSRLKELQQEIDRMQLQQRQAPGDYYPERKSLDADKMPATTKNDYIAYPKAMKILRERWGATPEELAAWVDLGPETGGIEAYRNANELNPPPRFDFIYFLDMDDEDYLSLLMACWFRQDDIERFEPVDRYITGEALIERWSKFVPRPDAFIRSKIFESRLSDIHPTFGFTQGSHVNDTSRPPLSAALFSMKDIKDIEAEDALDFDQVLPSSDAELKMVFPVSNSPDAPSVAVADPCADFRLLENLHPSEISITFVGDSSESGLSGNNMLEISARSVTRRIALAEFGLLDRRTGSLTKQAAVLVGLAHGERFYRKEEKNSAIMTRLRAEIRNRLGVKANPFTPYHHETGWLPVFSIIDLRGRSDERTKHDAERRMVSFDQRQDQGLPFLADESSNTVDDDADTWLEKNDPKHLS